MIPQRPPQVEGDDGVFPQTASDDRDDLLVAAQSHRLEQVADHLQPPLAFVEGPVEGVVLAWRAGLLERLRRLPLERLAVHPTDDPPPEQDELGVPLAVGVGAWLGHLLKSAAHSISPVIGLLAAPRQSVRQTRR